MSEPRLQIEAFENCLADREVWLVADGPSCPRALVAPPGVTAIAVGSGFRNVENPYGLVYIDADFPTAFGDLSGLAQFVFHPSAAGRPPWPNAVEYRRIVNHRCNRLRDGVYGGSGSFGLSSGVAALTLALGMGARMVRLFGYDMRVYSEREAIEVFGRPVGVHASERPAREDSRKIYLCKIASFDVFAPDSHKIVNHSVHSNLYQFERLAFRVDATGKADYAA